MRVQALVAGLTQLAAQLGVEGWSEFRTPDATRIDFALTQGSRRLLAVEFERSRKWLFARVLYNAVKAQRAEFSAILFVYPYYDLPRAGRSWVPEYVEKTLGMRLALCHPRDCIKATQALLAEQLDMPASQDVTEKDNVIAGIGSTLEPRPPSLAVGATAWQQIGSPPSSRTPARRQRSRTTKTKRKKSPSGTRKTPTRRVARGSGPSGVQRGGGYRAPRPSDKPPG
jgi:hypothetical protein